MNGTLTILANSALVIKLPMFPSPGRNVTVLAASFGSVSGRFMNVTLSATPTSQCPLTVSQVYAGTTLTVLISAPTSCADNNTGVSSGALAGIIVGAVAGGVGIAILVVVLFVYFRKKSTKTMNNEIREKEMQKLNGK